MKQMRLRVDVHTYISLMEPLSLSAASSILIDVEIETDLSVSYPTLEAFLTKLENEEPVRRWSEIFLHPLKKMGVRTLDDMCIVSPESLAGFFDLSPIMIMDFYVHVIDTMAVLQSRKI
jgi:hypothetical protein